MSITRRIAMAGAGILRRAARTLERSAEAETFAIRRSMSLHDMAGDADERYYARQYWHWLEPPLSAAGQAPRVLDIGCAQGRFALPIAERFPAGSVIGVDITEAAVAKARATAAERGLAHAEFHVADARQFVRSQPAGSFDLVLMTEVSFFMRGFRDVLAAAADALRPGGIFFGSFRSQYYNLLHSVRDRDWTSARMVVAQREGEWGGSAIWFTWQTVADVQSILHEHGLRPTLVRGIGVASGIANDPLEPIARPSTLSEADREQLLDLELSLAEDYAGCGRYILAVATKPKETTER